MTEQQRPTAEQQYARELHALAADPGERPANWTMPPRAVVTYLMGGKAADGTPITPKYVGNRRLMESAVATLATDGGEVGFVLEPRGLRWKITNIRLPRPQPAVN